VVASDGNPTEDMALDGT